MAARNLSCALRANGIESHFWALKHPTYEPTDFERDINRYFFQNLLGKAATRYQASFSEEILFTPISIGGISKHLIDFISPADTVLHFHNWYNLTSEEEFLALSKAGFSIVLTLHDERFFTGGCHYAFDCKQFESICNRCPSKRFDIQTLIRHRSSSNAQIYRSFESPFVLVCPSKWIQDRVELSRNASGLISYFVPNVITPPRVQQAHRNWQKRSIVLGVASMDPYAYIKGGDTVRKVEDFVRTNHANLEILYLKNFSNSTDFWELIDFLLVPSLIDNSPNVVHEAKQLGIPVVFASVGGISEMTCQYDIVHQQNDSMDSLFKNLVEFKSMYSIEDFDSHIKDAYNVYAGDSIAKLRGIYESLTKRN